MDDAGLWKLFFATGLPQAWMAARQDEAGEQKIPPLPAPGMPGFTKREEPGQIPPPPPAQTM